MPCSMLALLSLRHLLRPVGEAGTGPERTGMLGAQTPFPDSCGRSGSGTWVSIRAIIPPPPAAANLSSIIAEK